VNKLFPVKYDDAEEPRVSARDLHKALGIEKRFSAWFETNSQGFICGEDYSNPYLEVRVQKEGTRDVQREVEDYDLSVDMVKHICLMSRTEKGKECRQYLIDLEKAWNTPEQVFARALKMADRTIEKLKGSNQKLLEEVNIKNQVIGELKPRADYTDKILRNPGLVTITQIAKDYGMSGQEMNRKLHELGIQFKQSGQWLLYSKYHRLGYTHSETVDITRSDGRPDINMNTKWTQKGRLFLYNRLKEESILPLIEQK
jgi:anti-repressor protein